MDIPTARAAIAWLLARRIGRDIAVLGGALIMARVSAVNLASGTPAGVALGLVFLAGALLAMPVIITEWLDKGLTGEPRWRREQAGLR